MRNDLQFFFGVELLFFHTIKVQTLSNAVVPIRGCPGLFRFQPQIHSPLGDKAGVISLESHFLKYGHESGLCLLCRNSQEKS